MKYNKTIAVIITSILCLSVGACSSYKDELVLKKTSYETLNDWQKDKHLEAVVALEKSCQNIARNKKLKKFRRKNKEAEWLAVCKNIQEIQTNESARHFFEKNFTPYKVASNKKGLFTGYYQPIIQASLTPSKQYKYPIYKYPKDLKKIPSRKEIEQGALKGKRLEIAYAADPVELFFLHIQGSGKLQLQEGKIINIGFSGKNTYPYTSIGKELIKKKVFTHDTITAIKLKNWLKENPEQAKKIMQKNQSYIFFSKQEKTHAVGAQGVALTAERSLAIDNSHLPYGVPLWLETQYPNGEKIRKLMVAQDTGAAIKGIVRGDIFFGYGKRAGKKASGMKQTGTYTVLLPK